MMLQRRCNIKILRPLLNLKKISFLVPVHSLVRLCFASCLLLLSFTSCQEQKTNLTYQHFAQRERRIVIWTNCSEFAQYAELFNKNNSENRAIIVYKENPALSLPVPKDELPPDIIVGSWLRSDKTKKNFCSLDYLFTHNQISSEMFYKNLLDSGKVRHSQYLLPVSFNLPAVIFDKTNESFVSENYMLTLEQLREMGSKYNQKKSNETFQRIGFAPLNNSSFLSLTAKLFYSDFTEVKNNIVWNEENLEKTVSFLKSWVKTENLSAQIESDFAFKYLFMPYYRQVSSGRTLFACTSSDSLFKTMHEQDLNLDYRWLVQDGKIFMDDSFVMMGIFKKSENRTGASEFISWFFQNEVQREILERKESASLETDMFGIAGGFSAVRSVTEHILPIFYTQLLSNLPPAQMIQVPQKLPPRWESYKTQVVEPYIRSDITAETSNAKPISEFEKEWRKKVFAE